MTNITFSMRDLYPNTGYYETSTEVIPDANDMDALNEDVQTAEKVSNTARGKNIFLAFLLLLAIIVFLGGSK